MIQEARAAVKAAIEKKLANGYSDNEISPLVRDLAEDAKKCVHRLNKDPRYKYLVQVIVGQNKGQGVRMGSRQFWDKDTDNLATVTVIKKEIFITACVFAVYLY